MPIADMTEAQLLRAHQLLAEAQLAVKRCGWALGEMRTQMMTAQIGSVLKEVVDRRETLAGK